MSKGLANIMKQAQMIQQKMAKLQEEAGDTLHYLTMLCVKMGWTWQDLIDNNTTKLKKRYPNGFSKADAIARADVGPERPPVVIRGDDHYNHDHTG